MKKQEIEALTRTALLCIGMCNKNDELSETDNSMTPIHEAQENYNSFLEVFSKLKQAVETQQTFDNLTNLRNQAHFKMKRAQHNDWLMEQALYQSEVDLYDKRIEILKTNK
jgi:cell fate (sporulation/competence/biofilm development) regulator YlbF (YheA/YmcA/DUF963 family)